MYRTTFGGCSGDGGEGGGIGRDGDSSGNFYQPHGVTEGEERQDKMDTSSNQPTSKQDYELPLAALINEQLSDLYPISGASCIYRVPHRLCQVDKKSYTPQTVSIGPFHHGKKELGPWEERKLWYLQAFRERIENSLEDCINLVKHWEEGARECYSERIDLSSDEFVKMMLLDSCFIIEVMWMAVYNSEEPTDWLSYPELILIVQRDFILLENQIPFFVLHDLFHLGFSEIGEEEFIKLSIIYFSNLLFTEPEEGDVETTLTNVKCHLKSGFKIKHLTDLLRICLLPTDLVKPDVGDFVPIPTATSLHEAGMKFETGTSKRLLDMKYNPTGLLEIPKFKVAYDTEYLLKNVIALETCHYPFDSYIIDYVFFMDKFIDTATDVDLLKQKGIIVNFLCDSAAVASLFNILAMDTALCGSYYFTSISEEINAYHKVSWYKWKATFKRDYCSTPWMIAASATAILVVVLTLISTICSLISVL